MYVQRLVSFKFPRPQITVVTNHPCHDTVTLNPKKERRRRRKKKKEEEERNRMKI